MKIHPV